MANSFSSRTLTENTGLYYDYPYFTFKGPVEFLDQIQFYNTNIPAYLQGLSSIYTNTSFGSNRDFFETKGSNLITANIASTISTIPFYNNSTILLNCEVTAHCTAGPDIGGSFVQSSLSRYTISNVGVVTNALNFANNFNPIANAGKIGFDFSVVGTSIVVKLNPNATDTWQCLWNIKITRTSA